MSEEAAQPPPALRPAQDEPGPTAPRTAEPSEAPTVITPPSTPAQAAAGDPAEATTLPPGRGLRGWYRRRKAETEARWDRILGEVRRTGTVTKVILLHARYTFGYLAAGFLLSAPLTIGMREGQHLGMIAKSLILGGICAVPFLLLIPFSLIDWGRMRLPEFKNLELALTRYATYAMVGVLVVFGAVQAVVSTEHYLHWLCDVRVAWINLVLMFFAWVRTKSHTVLFRDFYTLKPGDDLVLSAQPSPPSAEVEEPEGDSALAGLVARAADAESAAPEPDAGSAASEPDAAADKADPEATTLEP